MLNLPLMSLFGGEEPSEEPKSEDGETSPKAEQDEGFLAVPQSDPVSHPNMYITIQHNICIYDYIYICID
jgi:hypothetical protein